ncbi:MAG: 3-ketoacyl-ACP reductase [Promethearchaeia archaeon]
MNKNNHRVALITGSSHGIGKAILLKLAKLGYCVIANGASTEHLPKSYIEELNERYREKSENPSENFLYIQADISSKSGRKKIISQIKEKFGRIDVLVNNAGVAPKERRDILEATEASFEWVMKINLQGPYFLTQHVANWMINLKEELNSSYKPYIVNISSLSSYASSPSRGEYCISKAGVTMMTRLYADRLAEYNIPVYEIQPGIIKTPMTEPVKEKYDKLFEEGIAPISRWGKPEDVAKAVSAIVQGLLPYSTGDIIHIDGGFHLKRL